MPSNYTSNYHLSQWEPEDQVLRTDFNADNLAIDKALKAEVDARAAADAAEAAEREALNTLLAQKGNCTVSVTTYTGKGTTGAGNETKITFAKLPTAFIIAASEGILIGLGGQRAAYGLINSGGVTSTWSFTLSWSGTTCSISETNNAVKQLNQAGTHYVISFITEG